jgi:hypothetical protein
MARGNWSFLPPGEDYRPDGPFRRGKMDIIVCGTRRKVPVVSYRHYQALSFSDVTTPVTVVSRHPLPELPEFNWVTDLEPYFAGYRRHLHEKADWVPEDHVVRLVIDTVEAVATPELTARLVPAVRTRKGRRRYDPAAGEPTPRPPRDRGTRGPRRKAHFNDMVVQLLLKHNDSNLTTTLYFGGPRTGQRADSHARRPATALRLGRAAGRPSRSVNR